LRKNVREVDDVPVKDVPPGLCIRQSFPLFEQLAEATQGWEMDFRQLSAASSPFRLEQLSTPRMLYCRAYLGSQFHQLGGPALGFRTFALHSRRCSDFRWCGEAVNRHSLIVMPVGGEFESVSEPGFDIFTLSLSNTLLERTAEIQFQRPLSAFMGSSGQVCHLASARVYELRTLLHRLSSDIEQSSAAEVLPHRAPTLTRLEQTLAQLVLACLDRGENQAPRGSRGKRAKTLGKAVELIEQRSPQNVSVTDLVAYTNVSRRTLEHAFQDGIGVSPAAYLKASRLKLLNRNLLVVDGGETSVAGICEQHGFTHFGQLAADYRKMFGELPSATLRRSG
jgi:AraC family ethanolamine operon transcriptional activator